ncbi:MAG: YaaR family protein [Desulfitobacteriia bacterium]|jgi:uncharacterized protein YaaR (DUF327 family)
MSLRVDSSGQTNTRLNFDPQTPGGKKEANFQKVLGRTEQLQNKELTLFLNRLDAQGKKLAESLSLEDLVTFKNMIQDFLKTTFGKSRVMQEEVFWDFSGQPKTMARVSKIDRALEDLGEQVLSSQAEALKILAKIDEIKGLIIDLFA